VELLHTRGIFTQPYDTTPVKFREYLLPAYFTCTAYLIDNESKKVTNDNFKTFKVWSIELLLRTSKNNVIEVIRTELLGARTFRGHDVITTKSFDPSGYGSLKAKHYELAGQNRSRLMGYAVTVAIQSNIYKRNADGGHSWTIGSRVDISEAELNKVMKLVENRSYVRLDDAFYKDFSEQYLQAGKTPIVELASPHRFNKDPKTIQRYATEARRRGYLPETEPGKASKTRQNRKKGR
jgi:hypothetical protein